MPEDLPPGPTDSSAPVPPAAGPAADLPGSASTPPESAFAFPEAQAPGPLSELATDPPAAWPPPFSRLGTILWSAALAVGLGFVLFFASSNREQMLEQPDRYLDRVLGRDLDAAEYAPHLSFWAKLMNAGDVTPLPDAIKDAIDGYRDFLDSGTMENADHAREVLAVLYAESGNRADAQMQIKQLRQSGGASDFITLLFLAYSTNTLQMPPAHLARVPPLSPEWVHDKLSLRLAEKRQDARQVQAIQSRLIARGRRWQARATIDSAANLALVLGGLISIGCWWVRGRRSLTVAEGSVVSSWTVGEGYAVLVRGAVMGIILAGATAYLGDYFLPITGVSTLLCGIPLLLLMRKHLLPSAGRSFGAATGLWLNPGAWPRGLGISLAVLAAMIVGEAALSSLTSGWQSGPLIESIPEEFLFDSWSAVLLSGVDAIIWAPLIEETAFRGLLYPTLRRRLPLIPAAALSAIIFGAVHGYSFQGFLVIFWSGFLWALLFEKTRSLWPGIVCHAVSNTLALASPILLYRI